MPPIQAADPYTSNNSQGCPSDIKCMDQPKTKIYVKSPVQSTATVYSQQAWIVIQYIQCVEPIHTQYMFQLYIIDILPIDLDNVGYRPTDYECLTSQEATCQLKLNVVYTRCNYDGVPHNSIKMYKKNCASLAVIFILNE